MVLICILLMNSCRASFHVPMAILDTISLSDIWFENVFFLFSFYLLSFHLLMVYSAVQKLFHLVSFYYFFYFVAYALGATFTKSLPRSMSVFLQCFLLGVLVLVLTFKSLIHIELISMSGTS